MEEPEQVGLLPDVTAMLTLAVCEHGAI